MDRRLARSCRVRGARCHHVGRSGCPRSFRNAPNHAQDLMKPNTLTIPSLLSIILLPFHVGGDIMLGFDQGGSGLVYVVVPILLVVACGTLLLSERRSGYIVMFLGGLWALGMPILHPNNGFNAP